MPVTLKTKSIPQGITILPPKAAPQVEASPLRQRLKQRIEENAVVEDKKPKTTKKSQPKSSPAKPEVKKIPKVYASPSWYKSPNQRKIQAKNKQFDELRELFRKDGNNTEEGINKIINDLKF
jgi:hypothetical protein